MLDKKDIDYANHKNVLLLQSLTKKLDRFNTDYQKENRIKVKQCKHCYYLKSAVAMQAFTDSECKNCGKKISNPTSFVDNICEECSNELNLCVKCFGNL